MNHLTFRRQTMTWLTALLVMLDAIFTLLQFYHHPLDGDLAAIVVPSEHYQKVLEQPLGEAAALLGERYAAPNRHFVHLFMYHYFREVPLFLQNFLTPIESVYAAAALLKWVIHLLFLWSISKLVKGWLRNFQMSKWWIAAIICPFFQTNGYVGSMGLVQQSVSYTCFYSLPMLGLLLFFLPYFLRKKEWSNVRHPMFWLAMLAALALPLSGPLVAPSALIASTFLISWHLQATDFQFFKNKNTTPLPILFLATMSIYSLWLGQFNIENNTDMPLLDRYQSLTVGIRDQFLVKLGLPLLTILLVMGYFLLPATADREAKNIAKLFRWMALAALFYILLLPLGGVRTYRPGVLRGDTFLPLTIAMLTLLPTIIFYFYKKNPNPIRTYLVLVVSIVSIIFFAADQPSFDKNLCEKTALLHIQQSSQEVVPVSKECLVMSWSNVVHPDESIWQSKMLLHWRITKNEKRFYQIRND